MSERNLLRKYRSTTFYDGGLFGDPGDRKLEIVDKNDKILKEFYFKESDPAAVNKAIEKAKEWVNSNVKDDLPADPESGRYTDEELAEFKEILDNKVDAAIKELQYLNEQLSATTNENEKEEFQNLSARQDSYILHLNAALGRIADKTYGICRVTGKLIGKDRLRAVPHATLSLEGKQQLDQQKPEKVLPVVETPVKKKPGPKKKEKVNPPLSPSLEHNTSESEKEEKGNTGDENSKLTQMHEGSSSSAPDVIIPITDTRASQMITAESVKTNFFQELAARSTAAPINLSIRIIQDGDILTVEFFPATKMKLKPIVAKGTAAELDEGFFAEVQPAINDIVGLVTNIKEVKEEAAKAVEESTKSKPSKSKKKKNPKAMGQKKAGEELKKNLQSKSVHKKSPAKKKKSKAVTKPSTEKEEVKDSASAEQTSLPLADQADGDSNAEVKEVPANETV